MIGMTVSYAFVLLPITGSLAFSPLSAPGQSFFPQGIDFLHYVPNVPGTTSGRLYIGDLTDASHCHFRLDVPPGKPLTGASIRWVGGTALVFATRGSEETLVLSPELFQKVNAQGQPCHEGGQPERAAPIVEAAKPATRIPVSNDADSFDVTCDGRYAIVVGANSATPVSLVDLRAGVETDTFSADSNVTYAAAFDDGESLVVVANVPPQNQTNRLRRLRVENGKLADTEESLAALPAGEFPDYRFQKVFAVKGSNVGVATAQFGIPQIVTFRIPGLSLLDSIRTGGDSLAVNCAGDKIYVRSGSQIRGYALDPVTGALGDTPFLTISAVGQTDTSAANFGNSLAISRDGTRLIVPEGTAFPESPATPRTTYFDTTTGERLGYFDAFGGGSPTLVATYPCCKGAEPRLSIEQLASGLIQITATGEAARSYALQRSPNLVAWQQLLAFQMTSVPFSYSDPASTTNSAGFYRLQLLP